MYRQLPMGKNDVYKRYKSLRGSSTLEGFHRIIRLLVANGRVGTPQLIDNLLCGCVTRYNIKKGMVTPEVNSNKHQ